MHRGLGKVVAVAALGVVLAGCEGTAGTKEGEGEPPAQVESRTGGAQGTTTGIGESPGFQGHPLDDPASPLANRIVYFDFDSSEILDRDRGVVEAHAGYLSSNAGASITLEGHTDERGTREYNLGLGERRANSVRQYMTLLGASGQQIRTVSYGEERPAAVGHDEASWALNRRVEIIYRSR